MSPISHYLTPLLCVTSIGALYKLSLTRVWYFYSRPPLLVTNLTYPSTYPPFTQKNQYSTYITAYSEQLREDAELSRTPIRSLGSLPAPLTQIPKAEQSIRSLLKESGLVNGTHFTHNPMLPPLEFSP